MRTKATLLALLLCLPLAAADLKIDGPAKVEPYKVVKLKASGVDAKAGALWRIEPRQYVDRAESPKNTLQFVAPPGRYVVELVTLKLSEDGETLVDTTSHEVTIGDGVNPTPPGPTPPGPNPPGPTPPQPDGDLGLIKVSRDGAAKVNTPNKPNDVKKLAASNRSLAAAIAAGAIGQPSAMLAEWRAGNKNAVTNPADWTPWGNAVTQALEAAYKAGKLPTKQTWANAFSEIASGLEP